MHQRDYILRLIEQMGAVLVELRNRILGRETDALRVDEELASVAGQVGMNLELIRGFTGDTLRMFVSPAGEVEPARCWLTAELLYLDGLQASLEDRPEHARTSFEKALLLYRLIEPAGGLLVGLPEAGERVDEIEDRLDALR